MAKPRRDRAVDAEEIFNNAFAVDVDEPRPRPTPSQRAGVDDGWYDLEIVDDNPFQPRAYINQKRLEGLKKTLSDDGQLQAAPARPHPTRRGRFQLVAGHRRKAAIRAGANAGVKMPEPHLYIGKIRIEVAARTDEEMLEGAWVENEAREDFSIFDKARYYESLRQIETKRLAPQRLTPEPNAPNRGAAQTEDGLLSWEELVAARAREGKKLPGARTLRRIVAVLALGKLEAALSEINLAPDSESENGDFVGVTEKHCRALLLVKSGAARGRLLEQIAAEKLSANETLSRAGAMIAPTKTRQNSETATAPFEGAPAGENESTSAAAPDRTGAAASSSGKSKAKKSSTDESKTAFDDIVSAYLQPATIKIAEATRVYSTLHVGDDYRLRMTEELDALEAKCRQLRQALAMESVR